MNPIFSKLIAKATGISERQVQGTVGLLEEGCTIPFISRYRKEVTAYRLQFSYEGKMIQ